MLVDYVSNQCISWLHNLNFPRCLQVKISCFLKGEKKISLATQRCSVYGCKGSGTTHATGKPAFLSGTQDSPILRLTAASQDFYKIKWWSKTSLSLLIHFCFEFFMLLCSVVFLCSFLMLLHSSLMQLLLKPSASLLCAVPALDCLAHQLASSVRFVPVCLPSLASSPSGECCV